MQPAVLPCTARRVGHICLLLVCRWMLLWVTDSAMARLLRRRLAAVAIHVTLLRRQRQAAVAIALACGGLLRGGCLVALGRVWEMLLLRLIAQPELLQLAQRGCALTGLVTRWPAPLQQTRLLLDE